MKPNQRKILAATVLLTSICLEATARGGGAGGHSSHSSGSSSRGSGYSGGGHYYGGGGSVGGGSFIFFLIVVVIIIVLISKKNNNNKNNNERTLVDDIRGAADGGIIGSIISAITSAAGVGDDDDNGGAPTNLSKTFPENLTPQKVSTAFMEIQAAWQNQDLSKVRKWISDGVYQRFTAQFEMMQRLTQRNYLRNIRIYDISVADVYEDGVYTCADIAITFSMDDIFVCEKYPALNESYAGDTDTEYWTFVKRKDAKTTTNDLYSSDNCPNCGASLENKLGEVSRCSSCGTLVNNASYDWVLSEITQDQDYQRRQTNLMSDERLRDLVKNDPLFATQRMEDIASNVFMQIMEVLSGDSDKKLDRFATTELAQKILDVKNKNGNFVFDRLYLNDVTLAGYDTDNGHLNLHFDLGASYKRVQLNDGRLFWLDNDFVDGRFEMILSKNLSALQTKPKEIAYSYECASCGAPFDDTTDATCTYCGAPVVDLDHNWVLTDFSF